MIANEEEKREGLLKEWLTTLEEAVALIKEHLTEEDQENQLAEIKEITKQCCETEQRHANCKEAIKKTEAHYNNEENDSSEDFNEIYKSNLSTSPTDHTNHPIWLRIMKSIDPDVEEDEETDNESILDQTVQCSGSFVVKTDPISKQRIKTPCVNKVCHHVYDYQTIVSYIKTAKKKARCPYMGCANNKILLSHLEKNDKLLEEMNANETLNDDKSSINISM